jgi:hypothetical protein
LASKALAEVATPAMTDRASRADTMVFMASLLELDVSCVGEGLEAAVVELLVEGLGVEGAGGGRNTGDDRQGNQGGYDGLHGFSPGSLNSIF